MLISNVFPLCYLPLEKFSRFFSSLSEESMCIKGHKMRKLKLPKIVEENNCLSTLAAGIVTACKLKCWMVDSTQTIDLELLPVEISISSFLSFFFHKCMNILPSF